MNRVQRRLCAVVAVVSAALVAVGVPAGEAAPPPGYRPPETIRVSVGNAGVQGNGGSFLGDPPRSATDRTASGDGGAVVLTSLASNFDPRAGGGIQHVFLRDQRAGTTELVSASSTGAAGDNYSTGGAVSADARYVVYTSRATNLVAGDTNGKWDVFLYDRNTRRTERASVGSGEVQGNGASFQPAVSQDGRYVAFASLASNLVAGDTNAWGDVFVRDRLLRRTTRVNVAANGAQATTPDATSRAVAELLYEASSDGGVSISGDGRYVSFVSWSASLVAGDTNARSDAFVRDLSAGTTRRVSVGWPARQSTGWVAPSTSISDDGRAVVFVSLATDLAPGFVTTPPFMRQVYLHDVSRGETSRVSAAPNGYEGDADSLSPSISRNGRFVAFHSGATNIAAGDTNGADDVFVRDRWNRVTWRASVDTWGAQATGGSSYASVAEDGTVAFESGAANLVAGDTNQRTDVFLRTVARVCRPLESTGVLSPDLPLCGTAKSAPGAGK